MAMQFNEVIKVRLADGSVVEVRASKRKNVCLAIVNGRFRRVSKAPKKKIYTLES